MRLIPFTGLPAESLTLELGDRRLVFEALYSELSGVWSLSISEGGSALVAGLAVVIGVDLLAPYNLGIGRLYAVAIESPEVDAGEGELGIRVLLVHLTEGEASAFPVSA